MPAPGSGRSTWEDLVAWLTGLGDEYGVDPLVYAILYVGSAPLFFGSLAWLVRGLRRQHGILLPALATAVFFSLPTLYVLVAGRNLPAWAYVALVVLTVVGAAAGVRQLRASLRGSG